MSEQLTPLSYEGILELFRQANLRMDRMAQEADRRNQEDDQRKLEADWRLQELDRLMKETDRRIERTSQEISTLGSRVGEMVEKMVGGDIVGQFRALGYNVTAHSRNKYFGEEGTNESGEIDLLLEDGDIAILIEVKTTFKIADVLVHIERLEKYRRHINKNGYIDKRQLIGAVAGASVDPEVIKFAQRKGLYVIVQAGRTVEIIPPPEGFVAKKW